MAKYILAIDQGTTGSTACLVNQKGQIFGKGYEEFEQIFPKPGWVEHNPEAIWSSVVSSIQSVLEKCNVSGHDIISIGITNQRETVVVWNRKTSKPIHNAIVWQCRRTTSLCKSLKAKGLERKIKTKTGLVLDPYFSASKIQWILKNVAGARKKAQAGELLVGTIDSYLLWKLTNKKSHKTDVSNASRTMLMNLKTLNWDDELLKIFAIPKKLLPAIVPSSGHFGVTSSVPGLPDGIPITGIAGDQQSALFGQACFKPGDVKCTFGTGSFLLMNTGSQLVRSKAGLLTTVAWQLNEGGDAVYALEGGAFICGAAVQWLRDGLGLIKTSSEIEELANTVSSADGVEFVPALTGLGTPYWDPEARGIICGLTRGTHKGHIARATLEAMALQNVEILHSMQKDLDKNLTSLKVDGGASKNNTLMQIQSNYLGKKIIRSKIVETTVAGAAYLSGLGSGVWSLQEDIVKIWQTNQEFKPLITASSRKKRLAHWQLAIKKSRLKK